MGFRLGFGRINFRQGYSDFKLLLKEGRQAVRAARAARYEANAAVFNFGEKVKQEAEAMPLRLRASRDPFDNVVTDMSKWSREQIQRWQEVNAKYLFKSKDNGNKLYKIPRRYSANCVGSEGYLLYGFTGKDGLTPKRLVDVGKDINERLSFTCDLQTGEWVSNTYQNFKSTPGQFHIDKKLKALGIEVEDPGIASVTWTDCFWPRQQSVFGQFTTKDGKPLTIKGKIGKDPIVYHDEKPLAPWWQMQD